MNKYIKTDIIDGLQQVRIGIQNILSAILTREIETYILEYPLDKKIFIGILNQFNPEYQILYADNYYILEFKEESIKVEFKGTTVVFTIK